MAFGVVVGGGVVRGRGGAEEAAGGERVVEAGRACYLETADAGEGVVERPSSLPAAGARLAGGGRQDGGRGEDASSGSEAPQEDT